MNNRTFSFFTVVALVTLIFIRFMMQDASVWISCLNYFGLGIAVLGFLAEFSSRYKRNRIANFIKGALILILAGMVVVGCFIATGIIQLSTLANDQILLGTLLISLPTNYYCELLDKIVVKQSQRNVHKENIYGTK